MFGHLARPAELLAPDRPRPCRSHMNAAVTVHVMHRAALQRDWQLRWSSADGSRASVCSAAIASAAVAWMVPASHSVIADAGSGFVRSDFLATMVLTDAYLAAGNLKQACATALRALTEGELIRSGRYVNYLRDFRKQLTRAADAAAVTDFNEPARESRCGRSRRGPNKVTAYLDLSGPS